MNDGPEDKVQESASMPPDLSAVRDTGTAAEVDNGSFTVQLSVELRQMHIPLKRLQALGEGAVLPLDLPPGSIPVRLMVGDRVIAHGTLVSVGPGYGVLIGGGQGGD